MTELNTLLMRISKNMDYTFDASADIVQLKLRGYNNRYGKLEGYNCQKCKNRGDFLCVDEQGMEYFKECKCMEIRKNIEKLEKSGLKDLSNRYTFENFDTDSEWQKKLKECAIGYAENPQGWFFIGGQVGCGKTHLCTAIVTNLIKKGKTARYMLWRDVIVPLKACVNDEEAYVKGINLLKTVDILYIDDFFKMPNSSPTSADINIAYEIINYRYNNSNLITIISSEKTVEDIIDIDGAIGSRIFERTKDNCLTVDMDSTKNYRLRGITNG